MTYTWEFETLPDAERLPFVWRIDGRNATSYAIGTIHATRFNFASLVQPYLSRVSRVLLEIDLDESLDSLLGETVGMHRGDLRDDELWDAAGRCHERSTRPP